MPPRALRTPLTLAVLSLLRERPRHPYEIQALVRERHIDQVVKMRGGSLYDAIDRLADAGLITTVSSERAGARPERTVYAITAEGTAVADALVRDYLRTPAQDFPVFATGLAHILTLDAATAADLLRERREAIRATHDRTARQLAADTAGLPRVVTLEVEYAQALRVAELAWLDRVVRDIDAGALPWLDVADAPPSGAP
ncbi:PadR family transcriptional regulator [Streptomyces cocklensis]|jgi:DNA-binding PadR family transcriptional regulator|uniref:Transcriptional regulator, PadR family n=1 Tax=Actinacidiphila cocklensis TaxID=887465 RepID=A0A9W4DYW8_9ACTN|nr:PadR family transcriptional regulator [Actinacidiphila cocklensis]MDD1057707.1 PadR family transcriptional regulator [Actinacidiphila cocklensis]WSX78787.1 PadR family transcriptional regulator [Streptomyces sp. NBC_00899]CAG6398409.1 Transcriptional regulator, PadR family [Actinacidiphila cocklensis]